MFVYVAISTRSGEMSGVIQLRQDTHLVTDRMDGELGRLCLKTISSGITSNVTASAPRSNRWSKNCIIGHSQRRLMFWR